MPNAKAVFVSLVLTAFLSGAAVGQEASSAVLAQGCVSCHGPGGNSPGPIPSLDEIAPGVIAQSLRGFQSGELEATIMTRIARGLTDAQIEMLERHFDSSRQ